MFKGQPSVAEGCGRGKGVCKGPGTGERGRRGPGHPEAGPRVSRGAMTTLDSVTTTEIGRQGED